MTLARLLSPALRSGLMILIGALLVALPFALSLGPAAILAGVAIGGPIVGLGIAGTATDGRATLPISAHAAYDRGLAVGLLIAGVILGAVGNEGAMAVFGGAGLAILAITVTTRYSGIPA